MNTSRKNEIKTLWQAKPLHFPPGTLQSSAVANDDSNAATQPPAGAQRVAESVLLRNNFLNLNASDARSPE
jgi:hypothetical protein